MREGMLGGVGGSISAISDFQTRLRDRPSSAPPFSSEDPTLLRDHVRDRNDRWGSIHTAQSQMRNPHLPRQRQDYYGYDSTYTGAVHAASDSYGQTAKKFGADLLHAAGHLGLDAFATAGEAALYNRMGDTAAPVMEGSKLLLKGLLDHQFNGGQAIKRRRLY
jgi:hypothetical protein